MLVLGLQAAWSSVKEWSSVKNGKVEQPGDRSVQLREGWNQGVAHVFLSRSADTLI